MVGLQGAHALTRKPAVIDVNLKHAVAAALIHRRTEQDATHKKWQHLWAHAQREDPASGVEADAVLGPCWEQARKISQPERAHGHLHQNRHSTHLGADSWRRPGGLLSACKALGPHTGDSLFRVLVAELKARALERRLVAG